MTSLQPPICRPQTFNSLPLEVRDKIYELLLISSEPIPVFTKRGNTPQEEQLQEPKGAYAKVASLVTFGLLSVNRNISSEAAAIFYHHNVFKFCGTPGSPLEDPWDLLYSFLLAIGARNRSYLQYLEADIARPTQVWKDTHGILSSSVTGSSWMRKVYSIEQPASVHPRSYDEGTSANQDFVTSGKRAVALRDYEKAEDNKLGFTDGEHITNIEERDRNLWYGKNSKGENGLFSSDYVEFIDGDEEREDVAPPNIPETPRSLGHTPALTSSFDYVSPAIEAVFRMLGPEGPKLSLILVLGFSELPGFYELEDGSPDGWSGKIPDHIGQMTRRFSALPGGSEVRVDVLWQVIFWEAQFEGSSEEMRNKGWNVVKVQEGEKGWRRRRTTVTLRRSVEASEAH